MKASQQATNKEDMEIEKSPSPMSSKVHGVGMKTIPSSSTDHLFKNWWLFDDEKITHCEPSLFPTFFGGSQKPAAVSLFYQRSSLQPSTTSPWPADLIPSQLANIHKEDLHVRQARLTLESTKQMLALRVRHVDDAYDFDREDIRPGFQYVVQLHFNDKVSDLQSKVRSELGLPDKSQFFLIRYEKQDNGSLKMSHFVPDIDCWEEKFLLVKNMDLLHSTDYLVVPNDHPRFTHFADKISLAQISVNLKLKTGGKVADLWVAKYSTEDQLLQAISNFTEVQVKPEQVRIVIGESTVCLADPGYVHTPLADGTEVVLDIEKD